MFDINDANNQPGPAAGPVMPGTAPAGAVHPITGTADHSAAYASSTAPSDLPQNTAAASHDDLLDLKQQALQSLAPMVNKLDQSPEEKFKTIMMLIQASDNSGLVGEAYQVAQQIPDEKERAQALIDVVNEINYFTQQKSQ